MASTSSRCFVWHTDKEIEAQVEDITFQRFFKDVIESVPWDCFVDDLSEVLQWQLLGLS